VTQSSKTAELSIHLEKCELNRKGDSALCARRYVLANIETKAGVRRGDRVWQIAFGSGFKCNSAIWRALCNVDTPHSVWQ
jgi:3-ketoacyl-CoA synthase